MEKWERHRILEKDHVKKDWKDQKEREEIEWERESKVE